MELGGGGANACPPIRRRRHTKGASSVQGTSEQLKGEGLPLQPSNHIVSRQPTIRWHLGLLLSSRPQWPLCELVSQARLCLSCTASQPRNVAPSTETGQTARCSFRLLCSVGFSLSQKARFASVWSPAHMHEKVMEQLGGRGARMEWSQPI